MPPLVSGALQALLPGLFGWFCTVITERHRPLPSKTNPDVWMLALYFVTYESVQVQHLSAIPAPSTNQSAAVHLPAAAFTRSTCVLAPGTAVVAASSTAAAWTAADCIASVLAYMKTPKERRQQLIRDAVARLEQLQQDHRLLAGKHCYWIPVWCGKWQLRTEQQQKPNDKIHPQLQGPALAVIVADSSKNLIQGRRGSKAPILAVALNGFCFPSQQSFSTPSAFVKCTDHYRNNSYREACRVISNSGHLDQSLYVLLEALPIVAGQTPAHSARSHAYSSSDSRARAIEPFRQARCTMSHSAAAVPQPAASIYDKGSGVNGQHSSNKTGSQSQVASSSDSSHSNEGASAQASLKSTVTFADLALRVKAAIREQLQLEEELCKDSFQWVAAVKAGDKDAVFLSEWCPAAYHKALRWSIEQLARDAKEKAASGGDSVRALLQPNADAAAQVLESLQEMGAQQVLK